MPRFRVSAAPRNVLFAQLLVAAFAGPAAAESAVGSHAIVGALVKINAIEVHPGAVTSPSSAKHGSIIKGKKIAIHGDGVLADLPAPLPPGPNNITAKLRPGLGVAKDEKITVSGGRTHNGAKLEQYDYPGGYAQRFDGIDKGGAQRSGAAQSLTVGAAQTISVGAAQAPKPGANPRSLKAR